MRSNTWRQRSIEANIPTVWEVDVVNGESPVVNTIADTLNKTLDKKIKKKQLIGTFLKQHRLKELTKTITKSNNSCPHTHVQTRMFESGIALGHQS